MINVLMGRRAGRFRLEMRGHAGFSPGNDIVCAACSALACALVGCLERQNGDGLRCHVESGLLTLESPVTKRNAAAFEMTAVGLRQLSREYPGYVRIYPYSI